MQEGCWRQIRAIENVRLGEMEWGPFQLSIPRTKCLHYSKIRMQVRKAFWHICFVPFSLIEISRPQLHVIRSCILQESWQLYGAIEFREDRRTERGQLRACLSCGPSCEMCFF